MARAAADTLVGTTAAARSTDSWQQAYRAVEHRQAGERCASAKKLVPGIRRFANAFVNLQQKRHLADYDPGAIFKKSAVLVDIKQAETAINDFNAAPIDDRRAFAVWVVVHRHRRS